MLVVVAIIALLLSVVMPSLAKAKRKGQAVVCLTNMRQMHIAAELYANDNNQYYPPAYESDPNPMDMFMENNNWDFSHTKDFDTGQKTVGPGLLWQGEMLDKVQQCPSYKGVANSSDLFTGYNYNTSYIGHGPNETVETPAKVTNVKNRAGCALFGDGQYTRGANKYMRSPIWYDGDQFEDRYAGAQGYRHDGWTNVMWCDGHGSAQKELYIETVGDGQQLLEEYNSNKDNKVKVGFLSPDNSAYDLK